MEDQNTTEALDDRKHFLEGIALLEGGDLDQAIRSFRQATRHDKAPWRDHASVSLGHCLMAQGKGGAALRTWDSVAKREDASLAARWMALLRLEAEYAERGDDRRVKKYKEQRTELDGPWRHEATL